MNLKLRILFGILLICCSVSAQKDCKSFEIESNVRIEHLKYSLEQDFGGRYSDLMSCCWNDTLYFCMIDYDHCESLRLFAFDVKSLTYSYYDIDLKPVCRLFRGKPYLIEHFATNGSDLILYDFNGEQCLWVFKKQGDTFVFDCTVPDPDYLFSEDMQFLPNGRLLGLKNYAFSGDDNPTRLSLLDTDTKTITKTVDVDFPLIGFTFLSPYKNLSVGGNSIMLSQLGEYKISEYDFDLNKKGDLTTIPKGWKQMSLSFADSLMKSNRHLADRNIAFCSAIADYSSIHSVYADENTMLVSYKLRGKDEFYHFDIWNRENGTWKLKVRNINDKTSSIRHCFERSLLGMGANDVHLFMLGDKIIRLRLDMPDMGCHIKPVYMHKLETYVQNNELSFVVEALKFN